MQGIKADTVPKVVSEGLEHCQEWDRLSRFRKPDCLLRGFSLKFPAQGSHRLPPRSLRGRWADHPSFAPATRCPLCEIAWTGANRQVPAARALRPRRHLGPRFPRSGFRPGELPLAWPETPRAVKSLPLGRPRSWATALEPGVPRRLTPRGLRSGLPTRPCGHLPRPDAAPLAPARQYLPKPFPAGSG